MTKPIWKFRAREFVNCNCAYGCPCQFNALPTHGHCEAIMGFEIDEGYHGTTKLDGLKVAAAFHWPGPIHEGKGEAFVVIDERAGPAQREALLRILTGQDTKPGATIFQVFSTTLDKLHDPVFAPIQFEIDIEKRRASLETAGKIVGRGEPIKNPVTGAPHRVRIDMPEGFEYHLAEIGRGWAKSTGPLRVSVADSHAQFCHLNLSEDGVAP